MEIGIVKTVAAGGWKPKFKPLGFEGKRVYQEGAPDVWLVFEGERHHISCIEVFTSLFCHGDNMIAMDDLSVLPLGNALNLGTSLVRAIGGLQIYMITGSSPHIRKHLLRTKEDFEAFDFDWNKVIEVPGLMLDTLRSGADLTLER